MRSYKGYLGYPTQVQTQIAKVNCQQRCYSSAKVAHDLRSQSAWQDLVEALSDRNAWNTPRKLDQAAYERNPDGSFAGYEPTPPFEYHDGYLHVHFDTNRYQVRLVGLQRTCRCRESCKLEQAGKHGLSS